MNQTPEQESSYKLEILPSFPANLFDFKKYNGLKTICVVILLISLIYFIFSFMNILDNQYIMPPPQLRTWSDPFKALFSSFISFFHNLTDLFTLILISTPVILSILLCWVVFDPKNVATFVLGFSNCLLGVLGILNPADFIPDFIPVIGTTDDVFSGGLIALGAVFLVQAQKQKEKVNNIVELMNDQNQDKALQLLLEDQGITVRRNQ